MASTTQPGFEILGTFYTFPTSFRMADPVLVTELTGLEFPTFAEMLDDDDRRTDPVVLLGLIGVAVWQANPRWRRDRVVRFLEQLEISQVEFIAGDDAEGTEPGRPPAVAGPDDSSPSPPGASPSSADITSDDASQNSTTLPGLDTDTEE